MYGPPRMPQGGPGPQQPPMRGPPRHPHPNRVQPLVSAQYDDDQSSSGMLQQGCVLMVYGLNPDKINCQRLFNLFCLYGNVVRVSLVQLIAFDH